MQGIDVATVAMVAIVASAVLAAIMAAVSPPGKELGIFLMVFLLGPLGFIIAIVYLALQNPTQTAAASKEPYEKRLNDTLKEFFSKQRYAHGASNTTLKWLRSELPLVKLKTMRTLYKTNSEWEADRVCREKLDELTRRCANIEKSLNDSDAQKTVA
jgi:hypothetical protein